MFQYPGEPLRSARGLRGEPRRYRSSDRMELPFDRGRETVCTPANERLEPCDRQIESAEIAALASPVLASVPIALERDDASHKPTLVAGSDTDGSDAPGQATRTLVMGARCSATVNHERPESMLQKTLPLVAPNHRPSAWT